MSSIAAQDINDQAARQYKELKDQITYALVSDPVFTASYFFNHDKLVRRFEEQLVADGFHVRYVTEVKTKTTGVFRKKTESYTTKYYEVSLRNV